MKTKNFLKVLGVLIAVALLLAVLPQQAKAQGVESTIPVYVLAPSWTAEGGGGVFSAYVAPPEYLYVSPGSTGLYQGREAGIIKAGITPRSDGHYDDEGLFGFIPTVTIETLAAGPLTYDVIAQVGVNPVWMTIELDTGTVGERSDNTTYQFVPTTNPAGWHTVNAAGGLWQKWNNNSGDTTGNPLITLSRVAIDHPGVNVVRVYLRLGMGDSYNNGGTGTINWVDKVQICTTIYDFQVKDWYVAPVGNDGNLGTLESPFATIQHAVDVASDGDTIHVAAGTYTEQVTIDKSIHLVGAGAGTTTIKAPATLPAASQPGSAIILVSGTEVEAEITGFTVSGPGPTGCGSIRAGIYVYDDAFANIHHNDLVDIRDSGETISGCQNGIAIAVGRQAGSTSGTATIANNNFIRYQKGAIVVDNSGSAATITGNTITGAGTTTITAQNGIQISRGATATLSGNSVSGNSYHLEGSQWDWGATGILLYDAGNVSFTGGNNFSGNDSHVYISGAGTVTMGAETFGQSSAPLNSGYFVINYKNAPLSLTQATFPTTDPFEIASRIWDGIDEAGLGLATWVVGKVYVNPEGSIQRAIDLATTGDTVNVAAGMYAETLTINKRLTLLGPNAGISPITGTRGDEAVISYPAGITADKDLVSIAADDVTIDGFTMDGKDLNATLWGEGIYSEGNNLTVKNNIVKNFRQIGIRAGALYGGQYFTGALIENNKVISDVSGIYFTYSGIYLQGTQGTVRGNYVNSAYRGIQIQPYTNPSTTQGVVENNTFIAYRSPMYFNYSEHDNSNWVFRNNIAQGIASLEEAPLDYWSGIVIETFIKGNVLFERNQVLLGTANATNNYLYYERGTVKGTRSATPNWWGSVLGPAVGKINGTGQYDPWCGDAACSFLVSANEPTESGIFVRNGQLIIKGHVNVPGGIIINEPHTIVKLLPGAVVENNSPCFVINASYTQIIAEPGAKCIPTGGSNGIDVAADLVNIVVDGLEIDGSGQFTGDGIHFAGAVTDVLLKDNKIHDLDGDGVEFGGQPTGVIDIHGNLFQNNGGVGINNGGSTAFDATYNSWGSYGGPNGTNGDGVSSNVTFDPWTHADITVEPVVSNTTSRVVTTLANVSGRPTVLKDGAVYHMWYGTNDTKLYHTFSTNPAEFPAGVEVTFDTKPVEVASPAIIKEGETFYMIAYGSDNSEFALYTSADGNTWTKGSVVFDGTGMVTGFVKVDAPFLFKDGSTYRLYFQVKTGSGATERYNIYAAESTSIGGMYTLVNSGNPVLSPAASTAAWDGKYVMHPWVVFDGTTYYMWYSAHNSVKPQQIGVATSTDGISWTKSAANPVIGPVGEPAVIKDGDIWRIWYLGAGSSIKYQSALDPLDLRQTLAYQVTANLVKVSGSDITLNYPAALFTVAEIKGGPDWGTPIVNNDATNGVLKVGVSKIPGVVTGTDKELFTVVFMPKIAGTHATLPDVTAITFAMPAAGSSTNVYLAAATDNANATVNELPSLTTTFGDAYYLTDDAQSFDVVITNKGTAYPNAELRLGIPAGVTLTLSGTEYSLTDDIVDLGDLAASEVVSLTFTAKISTSGPKTMSFDVYDTSGGLLLFSTVETATVYTKPTISSTDIVGPYQINVAKTIHITVSTPDVIASSYILNLSLPAGTGVTYGSNSYTCDEDGCVIPVMLSAGDNVLEFSVKFVAAGSSDVTATLKDNANETGRVLATKSWTGLKFFGNFTVTGTVSMQGRTYRGGVVMTLTPPTGYPYGGPFNATSLDQLSNNLVWTGIYSNSTDFAITTTQDRYLNVTTDLGAHITIGTDSQTIAPLVLRGGNVTDTGESLNKVDVSDAGVVGGNYWATGNNPGDANFDLIVNIQDLALVGSNYLVTSATAYAGWMGIQ